MPRFGLRGRIGLLAIATLCLCQCERADGPLVQVGDPNQALGMPVEIGDAYSFGTLHVRTDGEAVTLLHVDFVSPTDGLELLGALVVPTADSGVGTDLGFPPAGGPDNMQPLAHATLTPGVDTQIIVGFKVTSRGRFTSEALSVTYKFRDQEFVEEFPVSVRACAPALEPDGESVNCPTLIAQPLEN